MDRSIRRLGLFLMVLFCALFAQVNYIQFFQADHLNERPGNSRPVDAAFARPRGTVSTRDGVILARSVPVDTKRSYLRDFPQGELYGHITGYFNYSFGATGVEDAYNDELAGTTIRQQYRDLSDIWQERDHSGNLRLTVRSDVQEAARNAVAADPEALRGSVVAVEPRTGGVLGLWSWPSYDPNALSTHDDESAQAAKALLEAAEAKPLLPRAYRELYPPGSTFKVVTAATGLATGAVTPESTYPVETSWTPPKTSVPLPNYGGSSCGGDLFTILQRSCNAAFGRMAVEEIGGDDMLAGARAFGFDARPPFDLPAVTSRFPDIDFDEGPPFLAQSAIGQYDVRATPLHMALVSAAFVNGGEMPTPHIVDEITDQDNKVIERVAPGAWQRAVDPQTAQTMEAAMEQVVTAGTLRQLQIPGLRVGGKTGTAQIGDSGRSHAWVIAWAYREGEADPFIAVAVIVENQTGQGTGTGGQKAGPIARAVIEAAAAPMPDPPAELPPLPPEASTPEAPEP